MTSGRDAQAILRKGTHFDAVLTDLRMPDVSGDRLLAFIESKRPDLSGRVVLMTGDALGPEVVTNSSDVPVIVKPLELSSLRQALRPMMDARKKRVPAVKAAGANKKEKA